MNIFTIIYIAIGVFVLWIIGSFNSLVTRRFRVREALSDIDVQSKRRFDLIPNLMETVKGYMAHEKTVFENVTRARTAAMGATGDPLAKAQGENMLSGALKSLFAVAENYPELKANTNFLELQRELSDTENKMMAARRFYNDTVTDLNVKIGTFPSNIIAGMFRFKEEKFFEVGSEAEKQPVKVAF